MWVFDKVGKWIIKDRSRTKVGARTTHNRVLDLFEELLSDLRPLKKIASGTEHLRTEYYTNLKQNATQSARAESANKGAN